MIDEKEIHLNAYEQIEGMEMEEEEADDGELNFENDKSKF